MSDISGGLALIGNQEYGHELAASLIKAGYKIDYLISISEEKAIDQRVSGFKNYKILADKYDIPLYVAEKFSLKSESDVNFFKTRKFSILIQGGWQRIIPEEILQTLTVGAVGVHGSMDFLPFGRGRSPLNWSLIENRKRFVFQYFLMKPGVDDGDIFAYKSVDINPWDDIQTLYLKNRIVTSQVLIESIPGLINQDIKFVPQEGVATYYPKRDESMGKIDLSKDLFEIYNMIRGLTHPYPGAFLFKDKHKVMIWKAQPLDTRIDTPSHEVGSITNKFENGQMVLKVLGGLLLISSYESEVTLNEGDKLI